MKLCYWVLSATLVVLSEQVTAQDIGLGLLDDFEDGTEQGWTRGPAGQNQPTNIPDGGDGGAGDNYLENLSTGEFGSGGKQVMFNRDAHWTGDWLAVGVNKIRVNIANLGDVPLAIRIALRNLPTLSCYALTSALEVPADAQWRNYEILIDESTMTSVSGDLAFADVASDVSEIRVLSAVAGPSCMGDRVFSIAGYDDFQTDADSDLDGVNDSVDNCSEVANPRVCIDSSGAAPVPAPQFTTEFDCVEVGGLEWDQPDTDGDFYGNACDFDIAPQPGPFPGGDCQQNFLDLQALKNAFFSNPAQPQYNPDADFDFDGSINFTDLQALKNGLFGTPGPGLGNCP